MYRLLSVDQRARLLQNIVGAMKPVEKDENKLRQITHFYKADPAFGKGLPMGQDCLYLRLNKTSFI